MSEETQAPPPGASPRSRFVPPPDRRFGQPNGNPKSPGGFPKGFYPLSKAYRDLLAWPRADLEAFLADAWPDEMMAGPGGELVPRPRPPLPKGIVKKIKGSHLIARGMFLAAMSPSATGQVRAASEIADRTEGKVTQPLDVNARIQTVADLVRQLEGEEAAAVLPPNAENVP